MLETLKKMLGIVQDLLYSAHLYDRYVNSCFISQFLSIFMLMVNIKNIELINATESCL